MTGLGDKIRKRLTPEPKPEIERSEYYAEPEGPKEKKRTIVKDERKERIPPEENLAKMRRDINNAITSGQLDIVFSTDDARRYVAMCREYVSRMEALDPDNEFRSDLVLAETEPDYVMEGRALLEACDRLELRRGTSFTRKPEITTYEPDQERLSKRERVGQEDGDHYPEDY